jgi:hypothetical protein
MWCEKKRSVPRGGQEMIDGGCGMNKSGKDEGSEGGDGARDKRWRDGENEPHIQL